MIFLQFHSCSCDVISPSFTYQDGCLHITSFSTLNANVMRTKGGIETRSTAFFPVLSDLTSENNMFFGGTFPLIDHIASNIPDRISSGGVISWGISDHNAVFVVRSMRIPKLPRNSRIVTV